jgi:phosphoadenosine phosphosulfate reductase
MTVLGQQAVAEQAARDLPRAEELASVLRTASPAEVIATALQTFGRERLAVVSSFGTESAALLKVMADVDPAIPVVFLDTGWLFEETLAYRDTLIETLGLRDVRSIKPLEETLSRGQPRCRSRPAAGSARWSRWPAHYAVLGMVNGRKRFQGGLRADIAVVGTTSG